MRQPIKFLPYLKTTTWGGEEISRFKGLRINCKNIGESWELSGVPGCESIAMEGDDCGMTLTDLVRKYKDRLVGDEVYARYGDQFPLVVKFIDASERLSILVADPSIVPSPESHTGGYRYHPYESREKLPESRSLIQCPHYHVRKEVVEGERHLTNAHDSFMGLVCVSGTGSLKVDGITTSVKQGESLLLPAHTDEFDVEGTLALLTIVIPTLMATPQA